MRGGRAELVSGVYCVCAVMALQHVLSVCVEGLRGGPINMGTACTFVLPDCLDGLGGWVGVPRGWGWVVWWGRMRVFQESHPVLYQLFHALFWLPAGGGVERGHTKPPGGEVGGGGRWLRTHVSAIKRAFFPRRCSSTFLPTAVRGWGGQTTGPPVLAGSQRKV